MFLSILKKNFSFVFITLVIFFYSLFENTSLAKISDKYEVQTFYEEAPIMPGAAKYFIRTERIEKKTKVSNNHPMRIHRIPLPLQRPAARLRRRTRRAPRPQWRGRKCARGT